VTLKVLTYTALYPNAVMPNSCVFVKYRMEAVATLPGNDLRVVAPVPYFPSFLKNKSWGRFARVPLVEQQDRMTVLHPRYPMIPKASMQVHWLLMVLGTLPTLLRLRKSFRFDLIDSHFIYPDGLAAVALGKLFKVPVVLSARGSDVHEFPRYPTIRPMIRRALRSADAIVSVCAALKDCMVQLGAETDNISVIPNGVDSQVFPLVDRLEARHALGLPLEGKNILSVGSLLELKGHHLTIAAMRGVLGLLPDATLHIIGTGPYRPVLEEFIRTEGLTEKVILLGAQPNRELYLWYNAADCFCLASSREGWPNVIMESLACGTPVVATNVWGAPEILTTPDVGLLTERTPEELCAKLVAALTRPWDRHLIRNHVAGRSWEAVGREVQAVFEKVLARR